MIISVNYTLPYLHNSQNFSLIITSKKLFIDIIFNAIYLSLIEAVTCTCTVYVYFFTENSSIKEGKLMKFLTGSYRIPVLGALTNIEVNFKHDCVNGCRCFPTVSTCSFTLELPIHIQNEEKMLSVFSTALVADVGFGRC